MSPVGTPFERPSTPHGLAFTHEPLTPDLDDEERLRYRSWREGKPILPRSKLKEEDHAINRSKVDKTIEATLPKADFVGPSARSRKTSHYLGLFKNNDGPQEQRKREVRENDDRTEDTSREGKALRAKVSALSEAIGRGRLTENATTKDVSDRAELLINEAPRSVPSDLLEQIRNYRSARVAATARRSRSRTKPESLGVLSRLTELKDEGEDEESEREQISSALYFPHRQRTTDDQGEAETQRKQAAASQSLPDTVGKELLETFKQAEGAQSPDEVQISLEDDDNQECLHGNMPATAAGTEDFEEKLVHSSDVSMTASESEWDSHDDLPGYESSLVDEIATTPTPKQDHLELKSQQKRHEHRPPVPVGAVELKPYDHQVGGHSTVYRFSRRAVCKQLNNKENEFYETVERSHPELLDFLPRYEISYFKFKLGS